ncbi:BQ2448_5271 [Microbotryum intermedium]|uniref:BQ2448_5271 protein n=1 Tax=Microbotryum intermedium TaxID=269621 RepID=A0A238F0J8_9BASI|nr:BQ2448_5271 [Microbotryum intermedium]
MLLPRIRFFTGREVPSTPTAPGSPRGTPHATSTPSHTTVPQGPLFAGLCAFFSTSCSTSSRAAWAHHGGTLARAEQVHKYIPIHLFFVVESMTTECEPRLEALGIDLHDQSYVWDCLSHKRLISLEPYRIPHRRSTQMQSATPSRLELSQKRKTTASDSDEEKGQSDDGPFSRGSSVASSGLGDNSTLFKTPNRPIMVSGPKSSQYSDNPSSPKQPRHSDAEIRYPPISPSVQLAAGRRLPTSPTASDPSDTAHEESHSSSSGSESNPSEVLERSLRLGREVEQVDSAFEPLSPQTFPQVKSESRTPDPVQPIFDPQNPSPQDRLTLDQGSQRTTPPIPHLSQLFDQNSNQSPTPRIPITTFLNHFVSVLPPQAELRKGLKELKAGHDGFVVARKKKRESEDTGMMEVSGSAVNHSKKRRWE